MSNEDVSLTVDLPITSWRSLVAMAAEDLREPDDFLRWFAHREAKQRGLLHTNGDYMAGGDKMTTKPPAALQGFSI